jgi:protein-disulfide isomerase
MTAAGAGSFRRRRLLQALGSVAVVATAGCLGGDGDDTVTPTADGGESAADSGTSTGTAAETAGGSEVLPAPSLGPEDAAVTVAVYKDYACPHCATYNADIKPAIVSEYVDAGVARLAHHDFPIPVDDTESWRAASAARAVQVEAGDEAFFDYADRLFQNQPALGLDTYAELAESVPGETVRQAANDRSYQTTVESDRETGIDRGVKGTPTVFVNGKQTESWDRETVESAIDDARSA